METFQKQPSTFEVTEYSFLDVSGSIHIYSIRFHQQQDIGYSIRSRLHPLDSGLPTGKLVLARHTPCDPGRNFPRTKSQFLELL